MDSDKYVNGMTVGRDQSPELEHAFQDELALLLNALLETKSLYQNVHVDQTLFDRFADEQYPAAGLVAEFKKRPINPYSRGEGNDPGKHRFIGPRGGDPVGTPHDEISLGFYLPNIKSHCSRCKAASTFLSMLCSGAPQYRSPYPLISDATEQVYSLYYRCATCRDFYVTFQVLRNGLKFQLTGRTSPYRPSLAPQWPTDIKPIIEDAFVACAEGDISAGYYHLRTALEFYIKSQLGIGVTEKIEGSDLCEKYNDTVDDRLKSGFPSAGPLYTELSNGLHTRQVSVERFNKLAEDFLDHLTAKSLFQKYSS